MCLQASAMLADVLTAVPCNALVSCDLVIAVFIANEMTILMNEMKISKGNREINTDQVRCTVWHAITSLGTTLRPLIYVSMTSKAAFRAAATPRPTINHPSLVPRRAKICTLKCCGQLCFRRAPTFSRGSDREGRGPSFNEYSNTFWRASMLVALQMSRMSLTRIDLRLHMK